MFTGAVADRRRRPRVLPGPATVVRWVDDSLLGPVPIPGYPFKFGDQPELPDLQAPLLGEHNAEVLQSQLGFSDDRIAELTIAGVLRQGTT